MRLAAVRGREAGRHLEHAATWPGARSRTIHDRVTRRHARRIVHLRARRGRPGRRRTGPDPHPGAVPRLCRELPARSARSSVGSMPTSGHLAGADLDRGHPQHDLDRRGDDRGRGRRDGRGGVAARAPGHHRGTGRRAATGRAPGAAGRRASNGWTRPSRSATGSRSRSAGPVAGTCSGRTAARRSRRPGMPSPRWRPRCCS